MKEELKRFGEAVASDKELEKELIVMVEGLSPEEKVAKAIEFANTKGFQISKEDLEADGQRVNLEEMEKYAGGSTCGCCIGGGGTGSLHCPCPLVGAGSDDSGGYYDCDCVVVGCGSN